MVDLFRWSKEKKDEEKDEAHKKLRDALIKQFNSRYGTDVEDIKNWQLLSRVLEISPVSEDLYECRHVCSASSMFGVYGAYQIRRRC
jgi:hypothetical protein